MLTAIFSCTGNGGTCSSAVVSPLMLNGGKVSMLSVPMDRLCWGLKDAGGVREATDVSSNSSSRLLILYTIDVR